MIQINISGFNLTIPNADTKDLTILTNQLASINAQKNIATEKYDKGITSIQTAITNLDNS